jgi:methylated-DNA-[protein]-cysteine S-methyltransferase
MPHAMFETALGWCGLAWRTGGLTGVQLPEEDRASTRARLQAKAGETSEATPESMPPWVEDAMIRVRHHLAGTPQDLALIRLDLARVTPLTAAIYRALQALPAGHTTTYGALAIAAGCPGAARAVGRAMATNPWPVIVPCHRVVSAGGAGGFSAHGGLVTKQAILLLEGGTLHATQQTSLFDGSR